MIGAAMPKRSPYVTVEIDLRDYVDWPLPDHCEQVQEAYDDLVRAQSCLSARSPNLQEALLRLERGLPLLAAALRMMK